MINGGYILQPRIIQESDISVAPPYVREIWSYLLREANCQDNKYSGHEIKRGQLFRSYDDIKEGTKWFIGWRKMTYNENQTKKAMKFLRDTQRITTTKELGGVMITVCKYDYYQSPKNYERTTKAPKDGTIKEPLKNQPLPDNNKNNKNEDNDKNEKKKEIALFENFWNLYDKNEDQIKCEVLWMQLSNEERLECLEKLPDYINSTPDKQFRKNPLTYLKNKSWNNEIIPPKNNSIPVFQLSNEDKELLKNSNYYGKK